MWLDERLLVWLRSELRRILLLLMLLHWRLEPLPVLRVRNRMLIRLLWHEVRPVELLLLLV